MTSITFFFKYKFEYKKEELERILYLVENRYNILENVYFYLKKNNLDKLKSLGLTEKQSCQFFYIFFFCYLHYLNRDFTLYERSMERLLGHVVSFRGIFFLELVPHESPLFSCFIFLNTNLKLKMGNNGYIFHELCKDLDLNFMNLILKSKFYNRPVGKFLNLEILDKTLLKNFMSLLHFDAYYYYENYFFDFNFNYSFFKSLKNKLYDMNVSSSSYMMYRIFQKPYQYTIDVLQKKLVSLFVVY